MSDAIRLAEPERGYTIEERDDTLVISTHQRNTRALRWFAIILGLSFFLSIPLLLVWMSAIEGPNAAAAFSKNAFFLLILLNTILFFYSRRRIKRTATFDAKGLVIENNKYLYEDIERIGYGSGEETILILDTDAALAHMAVQAMLGTALWIQHGSKYVTVFDGLSREDAEGILVRIGTIVAA